MIVMQVPKDIRKIKSQAFLMLTSRNLVGCGISAGVISVFELLLFLSGIALPKVVNTMLCVILIMPFVAYGFIEMDGLPFEEWFLSVFL